MPVGIETRAGVYLLCAGTPKDYDTFHSMRAGESPSSFKTFTARRSLPVRLIIHTQHAHTAETSLRQVFNTLLSIHALCYLICSFQGLGYAPHPRRHHHAHISGECLA